MKLSTAAIFYFIEISLIVSKSFLRLSFVSTYVQDLGLDDDSFANMISSSDRDKRLVQK